MYVVVISHIHVAVEIDPDEKSSDAVCILHCQCAKRLYFRNVSKYDYSLSCGEQFDVVSFNFI